jgi:hypothetical protein
METGLIKTIKGLMEEVERIKTLDGFQKKEYVLSQLDVMFPNNAMIKIYGGEIIDGLVFIARNGININKGGRCFGKCC